MNEAMEPDGGTSLGGCREIASGVYCLEAGKGFLRSNVYFVRSGPSWALFDTGSASCARLIRETAESLFGPDRPPVSILLTHDHSDHAGSALELAHTWNCSVYVHPDEMPLATLEDVATIRKYSNLLDRWMILPLLRLMPRRRVEAMFARSSLKTVVQELDPDALPGVPDWRCVPAPGHTPGQAAFFRASDRVLLTGDAIVTSDLNSLWGILLWALRLNRSRMSGPSWYSSWDRRMARQSVTTLAELQPRVVAPGHGRPMTGDQAAQQLSVLADRLVHSHR